MTEEVDDVPSCVLIQRANHVVVFGGVDSDLTYVELSFSLFEPHLGLRSPEGG